MYVWDLSKYVTHIYVKLATSKVHPNIEPLFVRGVHMVKALMINWSKVSTSSQIQEKSNFINIQWMVENPELRNENWIKEKVLTLGLHSRWYITIKTSI